MNFPRMLMVTGIAILLLIGTGVAQQIPGGRGFGVLLCVAERGGALPEGTQINVEIDSDTGPDHDGIGEAVVTIAHGSTSSTHVVRYEDTNSSGQLDCGDRILSVT